MLNTETEILEIIRKVPQPALAEVKVFLDFLTWRYQGEQTQSKGVTLIAAMRGKATTDMTTNEILDLTRGEE